MRLHKSSSSIIAAALVVLLAPYRSAAADLELAGYVGLSAPTYSQTFTYDPGPLPSLPGVSVEQLGSFDLEAKGGIAFGGGLTWFVTDSFGFEGRLDTADISLETAHASFSVSAPLPPPLPDLSTEVALPSAVVDLQRPRPLSLNLRLRVPGAVSFTISGGLSYLPSLDVQVTQPLAISAPILDDVLGGRLSVGEIAVRAVGDPTESGSRLGGNAGLGLRIGFSDQISLALDARGFFFGEHRLAWERADDRPLNPVEAALIDEALRVLPPIEFSPLFFNVTAGIAIAF